MKKIAKGQLKTGGYYIAREVAALDLAMKTLTAMALLSASILLTM